MNVINFAFFTGVIFWIYSENVLQLQLYGGEVSVSTIDEDNYVFFSQSEPHEVETVIKSVYWSFTTLATVGFGDIAPINKYEKIFVIFVFMFGVTVFSYAQSQFAGIFNTIQEINRGYEEDSDLCMFLGVLRKFNDNQPIEEERRKEIHDFFDFKWKTDKNIQFLDDQQLKVF